MRKLICICSFLLLFPFATGNASNSLRQYNISVSFDVPASRVIGTVEMQAEPASQLLFRIPGIAIEQITLNGVPVAHEIANDTLTVSPGSAGSLTIRYSAVFSGKTDSAKNTNANVIGPKGISLTSLWYPRVDGLAYYRLQAALPDQYEAVSEADSIDKTVQGNQTLFSFRFDHALPGVTLIASNRYDISRDKADGIEIYTYFFREDRTLAKTYIGQAKKYLALYGKMLGTYPYRRFSIVENALQQGSSMPGFTTLGQDVLRLPFIPETSLGHEILHQWFGNSVYVDADKGNWTEGITTYLADHLYEEQAGRGREYRKQLLLDYDASVNDQNEIALREFREGTDRASRAVGYGKGAMVFHMLRRSLGDDAFFEGLRAFIAANRFRAASWDDIRTALEKQSGKNLRPFFKQWVDRKGLPELNVDNGTVVRKGDPFETAVDVRQSAQLFTLDVPVVISTAGGNQDKHTEHIDSEKKTLTYSTDDQPRMLALDPDYDVARGLTADETPPQIVSLLADRKLLVVPPLSNGEAYTKIIAALKEQGAEEKQAAAVTNEMLHAFSVVVLGPDNPVVAKEFGRVEPVQAGFSLITKRNPWNSRKVIAVIAARSADEAEKAFPKISHYGAFSSIAFDQGRAVFKKTAESEQGVLMELREPATVVDLSALKTLGTVIENASDKKIVYVGEFHDKFAHHAVQLEIIKTLYRENPKLAIGMEMFQRPFQKVVDQYIAGTIDERAFLKGTEYFKRWGFDYNLYKPILDFARSRKIPVVALNLRKEITDKISKSGLDSLTEEERKEIPEQLDFSNTEYRDRLKAVFDQHKGAGNFDFFYQAQILWDETMAFSVDEFLQKNAGYRMIVLAGSGHLAYGSGIPNRAFRRNSLPYSIVLNDADVDRNIGNYLVLPQPLEGTTAPKLMVALTVEHNRVIVTDMPEDSVAKKAGIKTGDIIMSMDGQTVQSVEDVKLVLFYKQQGETVKVRVQRKGFFGTSQLDIDVKL